jgi:hypothetical protein
LLFQGNRGELSYIIGYTQLFVIVLAFILLFKGKLQKKIKSEFVFWLSLFVLLIFFISSFSHFIWRWFPILNSIQFSTRLLVVVALDISVLVGFVSKFLIKKSVLIWLLVIVTIGYTILNWGQRRVIAAKDDNAVRQAVWISTCCDGEAFGNFGTPKWLDSKHRWQTKLPPSHLQVLSGQAITKELFHNSIKHEYLAYATDSAYLMENTLYFPGWHLMVDNKEEQINYLNRDHLGIITFKIPSGIHYIQVLYRDIPIHVAAKIITVVGFSIIFLYSLVLLLVRLKKRVS